MTTPSKTSNDKLVSAMRILAGEIESPDGVANMAIGEGADRIEELAAERERAESADLVQEACGGRCGDPYCNLSTEGELMRTPADLFPCRSDPRHKGTDYRATPGGAS